MLTGGTDFKFSFRLTTDNATSLLKPAVVLLMPTTLNRILNIQGGSRIEVKSISMALYS